MSDKIVNIKKWKNLHGGIEEIHLDFYIKNLDFTLVESKFFVFNGLR